LISDGIAAHSEAFYAKAISIHWDKMSQLKTVQDKRWPNHLRRPMTNKRKHYPLLALAVSCLIGGPVFALEPCRAPNDYYDAVDRIIDRAAGRPAELALTVFPSFQAEWGVRMIGRDVYFVQLRPSFWVSSIVTDRSGSYRHDFSKARVGTSVHKASLHSELAARIRQQYANAISEPNEPEASGHDGIIYRFTVQTVGCGQTWSPRPASRNGQLVELAELLAAHARLSSPRSLELSEKKILRVVSMGR
jgi:hypothetical protein